MTPEGSSRARRYAAWLDTHRWMVLGLSLLIAIGGAALSAQLTVKSDFANLLPASAPSVRDLRALQARARAFGSVFIVIKAADPARREAAARALRDRLATIDDQLVANIGYDDAEARRYFWDHRFLFISLEDLTEARDALAASIDRGRIKSNPLYIDLEGDDDARPADAAPGAASAFDDGKLAALRKRFAEAEAKAKQADGFVSTDGTLQLIVVRATFPASDLLPGRTLVSAIRTEVAAARAAFPGVEIGVTGDVATTLMEHESIMRGMVIAAAITVLLVALAMILYFRSLTGVLIVLWTLIVGVTATFGATKLLIGHFNVATAFLAAIVVGNGINPSIIVLARYLEELRRGARIDPGPSAAPRELPPKSRAARSTDPTARLGLDALASTLHGALRGTLAASLTAAVAYGSLIVTDFRGFRHFGIIGGLGMVLCWVASFTILPAALAASARRGRIRARREPALGRWLARLLPRRHGVTIAAGLAVGLVALVLTVQYVRSNPLEEDWRHLRSHNATLAEARAWNRDITDAFPQGFNKNISGRFAIALPDRDGARQVAATMRAVDAGVPPAQRLFDAIASLDDLLPSDQPAKLALLAEIDDLLAPDIVAEMSEADRAIATELRPPEGLRVMTDADVPDGLAWPFIEKGGERGRLVVATSGEQYDPWNVRHLVEFSRRVHQLDLPDGAVLGGQAFVFADMLSSMQRDAPMATLVALLAAALVVWLTVGIRRHGAITLACAAVGTLAMVAIIAELGVKVNFLDFIALPLTIGIGIDYAANIVAREQEDWRQGPRHLLETTGGAVFLCSLTTTIGYGSLLLSENAGIRSFGLAAILGEATCLLVALACAPAALHLLRQRAARKGTEQRPPTTPP